MMRFQTPFQTSTVYCVRRLRACGQTQQKVVLHLQTLTARIQWSDTTEPSRTVSRVCEMLLVNLITSVRRFSSKTNRFVLLNLVSIMES